MLFNWEKKLKLPKKRMDAICPLFHGSLVNVKSTSIDKKYLIINFKVMIVYFMY